MVMLTLCIDTQGAYWPDLKPVFDGGVITQAAGILNLRWEEFSALDFAREADLHEVDWDVLQDDTPGRLELTAVYTAVTIEELQNRLNDPYVKIGVEYHELTEMVERHTAETDC